MIDVRPRTGYLVVPEALLGHFLTVIDTAEAYVLLNDLYARDESVFSFVCARPGNYSRSYGY